MILDDQNIMYKVVDVFVFSLKFIKDELVKDLYKIGYDIEESEI